MPLLPVPTRSSKRLNPSASYPLQEKPEWNTPGPAIPRGQSAEHLAVSREPVSGQPRKTRQKCIVVVVVVVVVVANHSSRLYSTRSKIAYIIHRPTMGRQLLAPTATASRTEHYNHHHHQHHIYHQHSQSEPQRGRFQNIDSKPSYTQNHSYNPDSDPGNVASSDSWSLKRLLGRHGKRRYRVLEREPNRLRKRAA